MTKLSVPLLLLQTGLVAGNGPCMDGSCPTFSSVLLQRTSNVQRQIDGDDSTAVCAPYHSWPNVDGGVTCHGCTALVKTAPYGNRCDRYCESFGHYCMGAAEESGDSCDILAPKRCDEVIAHTSDMLCTCWRRSQPAPAPPPPPPQPQDKCAAYSAWPNVDNGVTCHGCTALVKTAPYGNRCDRYCESFGHYCMGAAEEVADSCGILAPKRCDEVIAHTSDMLCTCWRRNQPAPAPPTLPPATPAPTPSPTQAPTPAPQTPAPTPMPQTPAPAPVQPTPAPAPVPPTAAGSIRVVSYNLHWWRTVAKGAGDALIGNIKDALRADVLGLQECEDPALLERRLGVVAAAPFEAAAGVLAQPNAVAVGSKGSRALQLPGETGTRAVSWVQLTQKASGKVFWLFNTHWCLWRSGTHWCRGDAPEQRLAAARMMLQLVKEVAAGAPVVIAGDFNAKGGEPGMKAVMMAGFELAAEDGAGAIFVSAAHWSKVWGGSGNAAGSDQRPVIADIRLN